MLQPLFTKFPKTINREIISRNREFLAGNREFHLEKRGIRFSVHTGDGASSYPDVDGTVNIFESTTTI